MLAHLLKYDTAQGGYAGVFGENKHTVVLTLDLRCNDVFSSDETKATLYGPREMTVYNPMRRTFILNLTWKFNEARSKYRGSGAGEKQKARM